MSYHIDFQRGPHISLMAQLQAAVGFISRPELNRELRQHLGVEIGP